MAADLARFHQPIGHMYDDSEVGTPNHLGFNKRLCETIYRLQCKLCE